jgi:hypothetical protein
MITKLKNAKIKENRNHRKTETTMSTDTEKKSDDVRIINYVYYDDNRLTILDKISKDVPTKRGEKKPDKPVQYHELLAKYNHGTVEDPDLDELYIEGPEMYSEYGVIVREYNNGPATSMAAKLDKNNPEHNKFKDIIKRIYVAYINKLLPIKTSVGIPGFMPNLPMETGFKPPIYVRRDESGQPIPGIDPTFDAKVVTPKWSYGEKTLFTFPNLEEIPNAIHILENAEVKFVPVYHIKKVYIGGGKASMQIELKSAIIKSAVPRNTKSPQKEAAERIKQSEPGIEDVLREQIEKLTKLRMNSLNGAQKMKPNSTGAEQEVTREVGSKQVDISAFQDF